MATGARVFSAGVLNFGGTIMLWPEPGRILDNVWGGSPTSRPPRGARRQLRTGERVGGLTAHTSVGAACQRYRRSGLAVQYLAAGVSSVGEPVRFRRGN